MNSHSHQYFKTRDNSVQQFSRQLVSIIFTIFSIWSCVGHTTKVNQNNSISSVKNFPVVSTVSPIHKGSSSNYGLVHLSLADDLEQAASEIHEAAREIEAQSAGEKTKLAAPSNQRPTVIEPQATKKDEVQEEDYDDDEGIEHESGNIPFEWRVQLIHKHFGDSWNNRGAQESGKSGSNQERGWEKYRDNIAHGQLRERYTKKKIDILIEEWWNKEKWNRRYWDDYYSDYRDHGDEHGKDYGKENHEHHAYEDEDQEHARYNSHHGRGSHSRKRNRHSKHHSDDESPLVASSSGPHSVLVSNHTDNNGNHVTHHMGHTSEHIARNFRPKETSKNNKSRARSGYSSKRRRPHRYKDHNKSSSTMFPAKDKPACARKTPYFCQKDPDYPHEIISELIRANQTAFQELTRIAQALWKPYEYRPEKEGSSTMHSTYDCRGSEAEAKPLWAPNENGNWKVIVNTKEMKQTFVTERCTKRTLACATSLGQRCRQKFDFLPLVALDLLQSSPQLHVDWFVLPSSCQCQEIRNHI